MLIENIGLPGSGKSTTVAILKDLNIPNCEVLLKSTGEVSLQFDPPPSSFFHEITSQFFFLLISFIRDPRLIVIFFKLLSRHGFTYQRLRINFLIFNRIYHLKSNFDSWKKCYVIDEGLFQFFGSLVIVDNSRQVVKIVDALKIAFLSNTFGIIYHEISPEEALKRIRHRNNGKTRFDRMSDEKAMINLRLMNEAFLQVRSVAISLGVNVLHLNAKDSVALKCEQIKSYLKMIHCTQGEG